MVVVVCVYTYDVYISYNLYYLGHAFIFYAFSFADGMNPLQSDCLKSADIFATLRRIWSILLLSIEACTTSYLAIQVSGSHLLFSFIYLRMRAGNSAAENRWKPMVITLYSRVNKNDRWYSCKNCPCLNFTVLSINLWYNEWSQNIILRHMESHACNHLLKAIKRQLYNYGASQQSIPVQNH